MAASQSIDTAHIRLNDNHGFSLVELSIVLIIIGIILAMGIDMMRVLTRTSAVKKVRNTIEIANNALLAFAICRGRLPYPDVNGDGREDYPISRCGKPPCGLPYMTLNIENRDAWAQPYRYDVSNILTETANQQDLCEKLEELIKLEPSNHICGEYLLVCVTNTSDPDNGIITSDSTGYHLAAIIISGGEDAKLGGKNRTDTGREYELASNPMDVTNGRDDLVGELSLMRLYSAACIN